MIKKAQHPTLPWEITFESEEHIYTDNEMRPNISVTTFIGSHFKPFDEMAAATRISAQSGSLEMSIIQQWREKARAADIYGTNVHAYAEAMILNQKLPEPESAREQRAFPIVRDAVLMLSENYEFIAVEQIIFDPLYQIAGMIDLVARNKSTHALAFLDWKTCEEITNKSYDFALAPISHIRDSKLNHYALQLSIYAFLMTDKEYSAYPSAGEPVELALIHISPDSADPVWIPLPYMRQECLEMLNSRLMLQ